MYQFVDIMMKTASKSVMEQRVAAAVICKKVLKNIKFNQPTLLGSDHAEYNAISSFKPNLKIGKLYNNKIDIAVIRINKKGELCNARPCMNCLYIMKSNGFRYVYYSINNNTIIREKILYMLSIQTSHAVRLNMNIKYDNIMEYYEKLLFKNFPKEIKLENLNHFINYNLINILPNAIINISKTRVTIHNNEKILVSSRIFE